MTSRADGPVPDRGHRAGQHRASQRLLLVHAHPDDESIGTGATMAKYAAEGAGVTLVTCTRGELGVTDHRFLGGRGRWRDSGMMGEPSNEADGSFWRADVDEAADALLEVIAEVRPQVLVTYDANGFYGHPDHIQAHRVAWRAFERADGLVRKIYATAVPKSVLAEAVKVMRQPGGPDVAQGPDRRGGEFLAVESVDDLPFGVPDEQVSAEIDASVYLDAKLAAMRAHASQIAVDSPFFALSDGVGRRAFGHEYYTLLAGPRGQGGGLSGWERDLFAGLD